MNFSKSQSYSLTPDQYLQKFKKPHSVISAKGNFDLEGKDYNILNEILSRGYNDSHESTEIKQNILKELNQIVGMWMVDVTASVKSSSNKHHLIDFQNSGYGLKVFGSYKLNTHSYDGDIDILCLVPEYFNRENHFFLMLPQYFKKNQNIKEIFSITDALVPLIRLSLYGVQIDLLLARIKESFLIQNPNFFEGELESKVLTIHQKQLRSINGYRTALYLKKYVDKYKNYQITLKAIKMWAKNKGIYSQIFGYLGGAAFSIMLAKICQMYPHYSCLQLLDRFFFIYSHWVWTIPVIIQKIDELQSERSQSQMAIYTPLEPHMNAAHYISKITCNITRKQLKIASRTIQKINKGKKSWEDLFKPLEFFDEYRNFIQISVMAEKIEDFIPWRGNVESKIRKLVKNIESQPQFAQGIEINPYPRQFTARHPNFKYCSKYYVGIKCNPNSSINDYYEIDFSQAARSFIELIQKYNEMSKAPKEINIGLAHVSRQQISQQVIKTLKNIEL